MRKAIDRLVTLWIDWTIFCTIFNAVVDLLLRLTE